MQSSALLALALALAAPGCAETGEATAPALELGFVQRGEFVLLQDGGDCFIQDAIQGGYWVMPIIRVQGVGVRPDVACTLVDNDLGAVIADNSQTVMVAQEESSPWFRGQLLISLPNVTRELFAELDGHAVTFECTINSDAAELTHRSELRISTATFDQP